MRWTVAKRDSRLGRAVPVFRERRRLKEWEYFLREARELAAANVQAQSTDRGRVLHAVFEHWSTGFMRQNRRDKVRQALAADLASRSILRRAL